MLTGTAGNGKSAACNFFMQKCVLESRASVPESMVATIDGKCIELIDMPGFLDPISVVEDNKRLEFAKALINMKCGFHAIGLVLNATKRIDAAEDRMFKNLLSIYEHYLPYIVVIFTHGKLLGSTEEEQKTKLHHIIKEIKEKDKTSNLCQVLEKINYRYMILECVEPMKQGYHASKSKELVKMIDTIFRETGKPATNDFALSIAENLNKVEVDHQLIVKELAVRMKEIADRYNATLPPRYDFFTLLLHYASTTYSYASSAAEKCTFQ